MILVWLDVDQRQPRDYDPALRSIASRDSRLILCDVEKEPQDKDQRSLEGTVMNTATTIGFVALGLALVAFGVGVAVLLRAQSRRATSRLANELDAAIDSMACDGAIDTINSAHLLSRQGPRPHC